MTIPVGGVIKIERAHLRSGQDKAFKDQQKKLFSMGFQWLSGGQELQNSPTEYHYLEILHGNRFGYKSSPTFENGLWGLEPIYKFRKVEQKFIVVEGETYDRDDAIRLLGTL